VGSSSKEPAAEPFIVFGVVMIFACLPFLARLGDFRVHSEMADLLAGDQRSLSSFQDADGQLANTLGGDSVAVLVSLRADDVFSPGTVADITAISQSLMEIENFDHNFSLASSMVRPRFVFDGPRIRAVLEERARFHELNEFGQPDWARLKTSSANFVNVLVEHGPPLAGDYQRLQDPDIGVFEKTTLQAKMAGRAALITGGALAWGNTVRNEWESFRSSIAKPIEPLRPLITAYFNNEQNATRKAMVREQALADIERKVRLEVDAIQFALARGGGKAVDFNLGPVFPRPPPEMTAAERNATREWTINYPFFRNLIVDAHGKHAMIFAFAREGPVTREDKVAFCAEVTRRLQPFRDQGLDIRLLSFPHGEVETMEYLERDLQRFLPAAFGILLVVLLVTFRFSLRLVVFVVVMQAAGIAVSLGLAPLLDSRVSPFTAPLFPLLSGIHLTLLIHVGTALQFAARPGLPAISAMLGQVLKPSAFAALTTAVGLLSLGLSEVRPTREFGLLGAVGVVLLFMLTFGPGLVLLRLLGDGIGGRKKPMATAGWSESLSCWAQRRRGFLLAVIAGVVVLMVIGIGRIRTDIRIVEFLSPQSDTRQALEELNDAYGGVNFAKLEIDTGADGGVRDTQFFRFINQLEAFAATQEGVSMSYSVGSLLRAADQVLQENFGHLPAFVHPRQRATMMIEQFERPEIRYQLPLLDSLYDQSMRKAWLVIRTRDLPSTDYIQMLNAIEDEARRIQPAGYTVSMQGAIQQIQKADRQIVDSQRRSALVTATLIAIVLAILWRSVGLALIAFVANIIPVGLVVALQGLADVPLNSITIMVGAIAFGIAVDDTIHFITHWRAEQARGADARQAVVRTLRIKGRPIVSTTFILVGIMTIFSLSSFPPVVDFGWLSAVGFVGALAAALLFLPLILAGKKPSDNNG
tara:strand:- start:1979 stop:4753 length:2775 start_codon:yes stop_codon:yes gene_type:complete